jgi:SAM-dependent methyltransferase
MNWRCKALVQLTLSAVPGGERLNYFFQTHLTKTLPTSDANFVAYVSYAKKHIDAINCHYERPIGEATFYEFGAGWDMIIPLAFYGFGVEHQILIDIRNLLRPTLVNDTIDKYLRMAEDRDLLRKPNRYLHRGHGAFPVLLKNYYGIDYRAPCDPRRTGLESGSIDCITSTSTLEHIPLEDIKSILQECHRLLRSGGVTSFVIDYADHYSYFDREISGYNYLQYSDRMWALFNPALHYQNRLRHPDYLDLLHEAGFEVVEKQRREATAADLKMIEKLSLAKRFTAYCLKDLAVGSALLVARKPSNVNHFIQ